MPRKKKEVVEEEKLVGKQKEFLDPEEHEESSEEIGIKMHTGDADADIYTEEGREKLLEDDEIKPSEEAFTEGTEERGELGNCASCGKVLSQEPDEVFEREIDDEFVQFCSDTCAKKGPRKR